MYINHFTLVLLSLCIINLPSSYHHTASSSHQTDFIVHSSSSASTFLRSRFPWRWKVVDHFILLFFPIITIPYASNIQHPSHSKFLIGVYIFSSNFIFNTENSLSLFSILYSFSTWLSFSSLSLHSLNGICTIASLSMNTRIIPYFCIIDIQRITPFLICWLNYHHHQAISFC